MDGRAIGATIYMRRDGGSVTVVNGGQMRTSVCVRVQGVHAMSGVMYRQMTRGTRKELGEAIQEEQEGYV